MELYRARREKPVISSILQAFRFDAVCDFPEERRIHELIEVPLYETNRGSLESC